MIFYLKYPLSKKAETDEAAHLFSVRIDVGKIVKITNLNGLLITCKITNIDKKKHAITYDILQQEEYKKPTQTILIQAKTDKQYIEKMCELAPIAGITDILLFESEFSPQQQQKLNIQRLQQIMIRSCEQCHNTFLPVISYFPANKKTEIFEQYKPVVLHGEGSINSDNFVNNEKIVVAVGAEGGWSNSEIELFQKLNLPIISLGNIVLPAWLAGYTFIKKIQQ